MRRGTARSKPANPANTGLEAPERGLHSTSTHPYLPLNTEGVKAIINAAMKLLEDSGVAFEPGTEAIELFRSAGCSITPDGIVRIPPALIQQSLASVARSVTLWDRDGQSPMPIDTQHTWFFPGMTCIRVMDRASGKVRDSNRSDLETMVRVADALPNIDGVTIGCKNIARSDMAGEIDEFAAMAENTRKPLLYLCENPQSLDAAIDMAAAIRGGRRQLAEKPYFLHVVTPLPLNFARIHSDQVMTAVRAGIPVSAGTLPIGGASSPITVAGSLMHTLATDLAAIVLGQLVQPGSFCIGSSDVCFMEPASGGIGSFSQSTLADMAMNQVRRELGLPSLTSPAGATVARRFNEDLVWEISSNMMQVFYHRPATCIYLGSMDQGMTYSLRALLLCDDLAGLIRKMWQGIAIDAEHLALDLAHEVGPLGNFLGQVHTAAHCREETWNSRYFGANIPVSTSDKPDKLLGARIAAHLEEILATHAPAPLPPAVQARIAEIRNGLRPVPA